MVGRRPLGRMAMVTFALPAAAMFLWAVPAAAQGKWAMGTPMPTPRSEVVAAALGGLIYIVGGLTSAGGLTTFEAYDPATDTWQGLAPIPEARHHTATAALGGRIYVTGGYGRQGFSRTLDSTWVFDPAAGAWSRGPAMPGVRAAHAMAALDGRLFVAGGIALDPQSVWSYDPTAGVWDTGWAPLETLREHTSATVLDGKLYLLGGRWRRGNLAVGAVFDPATNAWTPLPRHAQRTRRADGSRRGRANSCDWGRGTFGFPDLRRSRGLRSPNRDVASSATAADRPPRLGLGCGW